MRIQLRPWLLWSAGCVLLGVLSAINHFVHRRIDGASPGRLHDLLFDFTGNWLVCAALAPIIFAASRRWPIESGRAASRLLIHFGVIFLLWAAGAVIYQGVLAGLLNPHVAMPGAPAGALIRSLTGRVAGWTLATFPFGLAVYFTAIGAEHATRHFLDARAHELRLARVDEQLTRARLAALQAQVNPHFLFNTLNTIAVRARDGDGPGTARLVEQLSDVLRRTLAGSAHLVPLEDELELVAMYLAIERARFPDRLLITYEIDDGLLDVPVPRFAVQQLVENAVRHGIGKRREAGRLSIMAARTDGQLQVTVRDDGAGLPDPIGFMPDHGIANTRERLRMLYGDTAALRIEPARPVGTVATLFIPCRAPMLEPSLAS